MDHIKLCEVDRRYVDYVSSFAQHAFHNSQPSQRYERKFIGVLLTVNGLDYFAPLSSFKEKHLHMPETIDLIRVGRYAVINLNNMFPVPPGLAVYVDISKEPDPKYRSLLLAEYRIIKAMEDTVRKNAVIIYKHRLDNGDTTRLGKRCNDFRKLEEACRGYPPKGTGKRS